MKHAINFGNGGTDYYSPTISVRVVKHKPTNKMFQVVSNDGSEIRLRPILGDDLIVKCRDFNSEAWEKMT